MVTDEELLQMVKAALEANPEHTCSLSVEYANRLDDVHMVEDCAEQHAHMLAVSARLTWAYQQRAKQLRSDAALDAAKANGKRVCQVCKAVEGDGRPGCLKTFPPQHRWVKP